MALSSAIEWTDSTWNPLTGCTKISAGCANCYAERMALRLKAMGVPSYARGFDLAIHRRLLNLPLTWRKPQNVFVNSMSDLFHEEVPVDFIHAVFQVMSRASWHRFQVLTKRSRRLLELGNMLGWSPNIWMGVTVESQEYSFRADDLRTVPARVRFLSLEPLLGPVPELNLQGIHWVVTGGESGPRARPVNESWIIDLRDQCRRQNVPFFFKQWGGVNKKRAGRTLEGRTWDELPMASQR